MDNKTIKIFELTYKKLAYSLKNDDVFKPLQCGKELTNEKLCEYFDNTGDNISYKNKYFCELTGIYWIWKNYKDTDYIGHMQYRRWLDINGEKAKDILKTHDIILAKPVMCIPSVEQQYKFFHIDSDLDLVFEIIKEKYPEFVEPYLRYIKSGHKLYYSNGFITTKENYDKICSFCFGVLSEFEKKLGINDYEGWIKHGHCAKRTYNSHKEITDAEYQSRACAYLFERLVTLFVLTKFDKRFEVNYILKENTRI